jgi:HSP20 family molecular chaperone IbpA
MQAELFGVADGGLDITITDDGITLKAQTSHEVKDEKGKYSRRDTRHAEYQRMIALPHAVDGKQPESRPTMVSSILTVSEVKNTAHK